MKFLRVISLMAVIVSAAGFVKQADANVAQDLTANYNKIVKNCGASDKPAYLCSGNLIRFTSASTSYHVWDPSYQSYTKKGIPFMYIRRDIPIDKAFQNKTLGLIYYPSMIVPKGKTGDEARCMFPVDGWTDGRILRCGEHSTYPTASKACQDQGIDTATSWINHFTSIPDNGSDRLRHQCGFDLSNVRTNTANIFNEALKAQQSLQAIRGSYSYNELLINVAPLTVNNLVAEPAKLPIQTFFYMVNDQGQSGLDDARYYQRDYYTQTGLIVPIVKATLDIKTGKMTYSYSDSDQLIK
ncbi:unnamed protein product [Commensalibacter communis]|uniref:Halovibrin HvnC n=1 Tax=Commensalibacter communis TaxID=2972786 RepID=A0A9W4TQT8_9PROT|nr:hypothetical protein [Commensalibacter communis]CAI3956310.1 unnamed protein product [Commensalibacter communis]CAI3958417.1 unnamed protein product [Commensalibacter communis]CAI3958797.1 unnamed protein product [Commensalibacter communis]CAI3959392.1 unnamed protein product [Commensalibacter communis]CAI3959983.1 unnamed protein product [Commensalibacter communis]